MQYFKFVLSLPELFFALDDWYIQIYSHVDSHRNPHRTHPDPHMWTSFFPPRRSQRNYIKPWKVPQVSIIMLNRHAPGIISYFQRYIPIMTKAALSCPIPKVPQQTICISQVRSLSCLSQWRWNRILFGRAHSISPK